MIGLPTVGEVAQGAVILGALGGGLYFANRRLATHYADKAHLQFRRQLIMLGLGVLAVLLAIIFVPTDGNLRKDLLNLFGIVLSASIALSSTTFIGNAMAGIMLRSTQSVRLGDYIHVGEHFGRITEMDLLHAELQTEDRDLTTLPNMYMITHPVRVLRRSGTILSVEVSLGYDVPRQTVETVLKDAATQAGLDNPFVQIRSLGDFSVVYAAAGLLTDLTNLIQRRRQLRALTMDLLHEAGIEIASPNIHSVRDYKTGHTFIPKPPEHPIEADATPTLGPDDLIFDKANEAQSLQSLRDARASLTEKISALDEQIKSESDDAARAQLETRRTNLTGRVEWLDQQIGQKSTDIATD
ncbi:MAG: mechanosensitive ion channel family protein [Pseudomonadota bacterium]